MIFISYARADRPKVQPLADALVAQGFDVWWDALIEGGAGFAKAIEAKLEAADAVIVVWSATSVASDWVRDEAAHARDRKHLVPVSIDGTEAPLGFRQYHTVDLSRWRGRADAPEMASLIAGIGGVRAGAPVAATLGIKRVDRRQALMLGGGAVAVIGGGLVVFNPFGGGRSANSVAVLPFANLSADKDQAYFSDGLSEEIRSALARNPTLKVAAPTSANTFRDKAADAKVIGSKLGVAFLLEGSVRRAGDVVRIAAELIDAKSGFSKWSQSFDRQLTDVFAVQSEIAGVVAGALAVRVATAKPTVGGTTNVAAYDAFLKGRALFNSGVDEASDRAALAQFDAALAADGQYAAAHAARARSLAAIASQYAKPGEVRELYSAAISAANRAVAIAPQLAAAHLALGYSLYTGKLDVVGARGPYDRAADLGQGDADTLVLFALFCARTNRAKDAVNAIERAIILDPLNPRTFRAEGIVQYAARNFAAAIPPLEKALSLNPELRNAHGNIGLARLMLNQTREARLAFKAETAELIRLPGLAITERRLHDDAAARAALAQLVTSLGDSALYQQAQVLAQWNDKEGSLALLKKAQLTGDSGLLLAASDPMLDPVRADPRFLDLLNNLKLK
jgi:TolB-like protein/tetratricopeptide (TPR) repeat protein